MPGIMMSIALTPFIDGHERRGSGPLYERLAKAPCVLSYGPLSSRPHAAPWDPWFVRLFWRLPSDRAPSADGQPFSPAAIRPRARRHLFLLAAEHVRSPANVWRTAFAWLGLHDRGHRPAP